MTMDIAGVIPTDVLTARWAPGSYAPPWTWADEEHDIITRICLCCERPGHYQAELERHLTAVGRIDQPVCLGTDGRVWDGHHRIVAARRLGFDRIPIEAPAPAAARPLLLEAADA